MAGHNDQNGSLQEMVAGRNGQSEGAHEEEQAQSIQQDRVPIIQKASSVQMVQRTS